MKKTFMLLAAAVLLSLFGLKTQAQSFDGGALAGVVTSQINGDGYAGFHQIGWTAGVFGRIPTEGPSSWQLELKYCLMGAHSDVKEVEYGLNPMDIRLHYIELPVMFRYDLSKFNVNGRSLDFITLEIGLSGDFLIRGTQSANYENNFDNPAWLFFSVTGNVGAQFDINDRLGINIRSMNSLTPCRLHPEVPLLSLRHYYNIALQATLTYTIIHSGR
ncbi:MAG: PorT family protein [Bacteroidales bacterium]|nr:PorT family protein [Bacteroidales bacterium]